MLTPSTAGGCCTRGKDAILVGKATLIKPIVVGDQISRFEKIVHDEVG
jgi:hypothetical protein